MQSISQILEELSSCSSCFHQSAFQSTSLNKSATPAVFPSGPVKLVVVPTSYTAENLSLCVREHPIVKFHLWCPRCVRRRDPDCAHLGVAPLDVDLRMWRVVRRTSGRGGFHAASPSRDTFDSAQSKIKFGEFSEAEPGARVARQWKIHAERLSNGTSELRAHQMALAGLLSHSFLPS